MLSIDTKADKTLRCPEGSLHSGVCGREMCEQPVLVAVILNLTNPGITWKDGCSGRWLILGRPGRIWG